MAEPRAGQTVAKDPDSRPLPEHARIGLLNYLTAHSLDEDYAHVADRRSAAGEPPPSRGRRHLPALVVLALFGILVATAAVQTARGRPTAASSRESLVNQVNHRRDELTQARDEVVALRRDVDKARAQVLDATGAGRAVQDELTRLGASAGTVAVSGPGVRVVVDDSPRATTARQTVLDKDLQILVNGLWVSGAEAVSINGQRLTNLTSIREAGEAITVNLRSLSRPYVVSAIGDPDQLPARFIDSAGGTWWLNLRAVYDLQFSISREQSLNLPAAPEVTLRHARVPGGKP
jgi:uncharacterized protein YlxW (UPF0749 family)